MLGFSVGEVVALAGVVADSVEPLSTWSSRAQAVLTFAPVFPGVDLVSPLPSDYLHQTVSLTLKYKYL